MGMQEFVKKWNGVSVEDDGCYMSGEAKRFVTQFRNALKKDLPDAEITIKPGHYDLYGFVSENGHTAYVSYNIPRYGLPVNCSDCGVNGILYRTARDTKDYTGGPNHFCGFRELPGNLRRMLEVQA